jgi:hypothetical protein
MRHTGVASARAGLAGALLVGGGVAATAGPGGAQQAEAARAGADACTYDTCALRRERVVFGERLIVGTTERRVRVRGLTFPVDSVLARDARALAEGRAYRREARTGALLSLVGTGLGLAGAIALGRDCEGRELNECSVQGSTATLLGAGIGVGALGGWRLTIADRALNRAIWWYNRDLPR